MAIYDRICRTCGVNFKGGPRAFYCPSCRAERKRIQKKIYNANGYSRKLGDTDYCGHCGKAYIIKSGLQRFCPECSKLHVKTVDRKRALVYYHANSATINPKRYARRRVPKRICIICGNEFQPKGKQITCSEQCRAEYRKSAARLVYEPRRKWKLKNK